MTYAILSSFAIIVFAALIHASLQLSVSMLTLLSGHALGKATRHRRLLRRIHSFVLGTFLMTLLIISFLVYILDIMIRHDIQLEKIAAASVVGVLVGLGVATWAFYYRRRQSGVVLWLPRGMARFLAARSKATRSSSEAFSLGLASVVAELLFIIGPALAASLAIISLPDTTLQLGGLAAYVLCSLLPLIAIALLVGRGTNVATIQRWREQHKRFLQFSAGSCLLILASFIFVDRVVGILSSGVFQ